MSKTFSNAPQYVARLQSVQHQISSKQLSLAAQGLNKLQKDNAHDPRIYLLGAYLAQAADNPGAALKSARRAHELAPKWSVSTIYLAEILAEFGQSREALELASSSLLLDNEAAPAVSSSCELLVKAAAIAQRVNAFDLAEQWLRQALEFKTTDVELLHQLARILISKGDFAEGIEVLGSLLSQHPDHPVFLLNHLRACLSVQRMDNAQLDAKSLLELDPNSELYIYYHELACGMTPKGQPATLIAELFDGQAAGYDALMEGALNYSVPAAVAGLIRRWYPADDADILDLGCGTGLLGAALGPYKGVLVGVDLSRQMINQAARRQVYDKFHAANLLDAMRETPAEQYQVITALDVFIYVGDLSSVIPSVFRILLPGGRVVFTCEQGDETGAEYALPNTYRYTHQRRYVQGLLESAGFQEIELQDIVLHQDANGAVPGYLVVARKAATANSVVTRESSPTVVV